MSQLSGAFTVEIDLDRLAEEIAARVAVKVAGAMHAERSDVYDRDTGPDPGAGPRRGATRFGAVVSDDGAIDYESGEQT